MGVNRAGFGIVDDAVVRDAAIQEIIRRYYRCSCEYAMGLVDRQTVQRVELLMNDLGVGAATRPVVAQAELAAREAKERGKGNQSVYCGAALELRTAPLSWARTPRSCTRPPAWCSTP